MATILFAGDSITAAQYVTQAETFAQKIGTALGYQTVINSAVSGQKAAAVLSNINAQIISHAPQACVLMIGTNDIAAAWETDAANLPMVSGYINTMGQIIDIVKGAGIHLTVLSPPLTKRPQEAQRFPQLVEALADLCYAKGVAFLNVAGRMAADARNSGAFMGWFLAEPLDNYHLSATGHQRIADLFLRTQLAVQPVVVPPPTTLTASIFAAPTFNSSFGNITGASARVRIARSAFTQIPGLPTKMRVSLRGHPDEGLSLVKLYVGPKSAGGDAFDASSLVQIKVGGVGAFTIPAGASIWSDWFPYTDKTSDMVFSMYCNAASTSDRLAASFSVPFATSYLKYGDDAASPDGSGYTAYAGYLSLIDAAETDGF